MSRTTGRRARMFACAVAATAVSAFAAPAANADVPWPYQFMPHIDGYAAYDGQDTCSSTAKPGTIYLRDHLNFWYGNHSSGITRSCSVGGQSEHKEGRALDWMINAGDPVATQVLNDMLKTDEHGNAQAKARRMGMMYIIFNRKIFRLYQAGQGWQTYTGADPHTDHIHFSMAWSGANKQTSWWTTTQKSRTGSCQGKTNKVDYWHFASGYGPLAQLKFIDDKVNNRTYSTQSAIRSSPWRTELNGSTYLADQPLSLINGTPYAKLGTCKIAMT